MIKGFKIRLFPTKEQEDIMWGHIHGCRFIWNYMINLQNINYKNGGKYLSWIDMCKQLTILKNECFNWLYDVSNHSLQTTIKDLDFSYKAFFNKKARYPKFKSRKNIKYAYPLRCDSIYFDKDNIKIAKLGRVKFKTNYNIKDGKDVKFLNPRISLINKKWILSFGLECENQTPKLTNKSMGIDLGIKETAVASFGGDVRIFHNINKSQKIQNLEKKQKHIQKIVSRKYRVNGSYEKSNNIIKYENILRGIYAKLKNIRNNYIHQITHNLIALNPKRVVMEDLNILGWIKNKHLSNAVIRQCLGEFIRQMRYKCEWAGIEFVQVGRFYPSSKTCSRCGKIKSNLKLSDRIFICECGLEMDRDENAARNLEKYIS